MTTPTHLAAPMPADAADEAKATARAMRQIAALGGRA